ncbi:hypothetical protein [Pseudoclavibacter helvolus]|uniref:hypothetical protein n=1 Tax=Pseudoclavibacter helvolus TaxID=255205 RepID=UPI0008399D1D|nr:hypothetical protein [Pseudoclavibacter helvolus]
MPEAHGADPGGLIDPASFPCKSADLNTETIASGGDQLASMGTNLKSKVEAVETAWTPIAEPYRAPEQDSVYALMTPAVDAAGDVSSRFTSAQGHIDTYASSLSTIKTTLSDLETRAADFRTEALAGYKKYVDKSGKVPEMSLSYNKPNVLVDCTWEEHPPAVEQNDALLAEYNAVLESISTAATTCANSINGLLTGVCAAPLVPVTAAQLDSLDEPMPWGSPSKEAEGVQQSIQKGFDNFVGGTFEGVKALLGFHPVTGEWSAWNIVTTLGGTADFLVSTAALTLTVPASWLLKETTGKSELTDFLDDRINLAATGWGGMVGWDHQAALAGGDGWAKWKEDGVAAGAEVAFGGLAMLIPGVNAAKAGSMAARVPGMVAKLPDGVSAGVSKTASAFSKAGSFLVGTKPGVTPLSEAKGLTGPVPSAGGHGALDALDALGETGVAPGGVPGRAPGSDSVAANASGGHSATGVEGATAPESKPPHAETAINQKEAPRKPVKPDDYEAALERAPKNGDGVPIDPRTGEPLRGVGEDGPQQWHLKWDPEAGESGEFVARNPGQGFVEPGPRAPKVDYDPAIGELYASGDGTKPGGHPPSIPERTWDPDSEVPGHDYVTPTSEKGVEYQSQISGWGVLPDGTQPEYLMPADTPSGVVKFDGHTVRGDPPVEVFLEAKDGYEVLGTAPGIEMSKDMTTKIKNQVKNQLDVLPEGAVLEWHVSDPYGAAAIQAMFSKLELPVQVYYTPKV